MTPEREKMIRDTWEGRGAWIGGWRREMPRFHVVPRRPLAKLWQERPPAPSEPVIDYLTFERARVVQVDRHGFQLGPEVFERITCEGIELHLDLAPASSRKSK